MKEWVERLFTWGNETFFPRWCDQEDHWTFKFLDLIWVDCPCCLLYRGIFIGLFLGAFIGSVAATTVAILLS